MALLIVTAGGTSAGGFSLYSLALATKADRDAPRLITVDKHRVGLLAVDVELRVASVDKDA